VGDAVGERGDVVGVRDVRAHGERAATELLDGPRGLLAVLELARRHHDVGSRLRQTDGDVAADAAAAAGHQRRPSGQVEELLNPHPSASRAQHTAGPLRTCGAARGI
jgi:hypothetical protein